jgi:hypothetical protein
MVLRNSESVLLTFCNFSLDAYVYRLKAVVELSRQKGDLTHTARWFTTTSVFLFFTGVKKEGIGIGLENIISLIVYYNLLIPVTSLQPSSKTSNTSCFVTPDYENIHNLGSVTSHLWISLSSGQRLES